MFTKDDEFLPFKQVEGVEPLSLRVLNAFFRAMRFHGQLMFKMLAEKGLYPGQARCLWILHHEDGITQRDLAAHLHVARPTVTVMLQKMERAGLITRRNDDEDQRLTRIYLTDEGRSLLSRMHEIMSDFVSSGIGQLSDHDQLELERLLGTLCSHMSKRL
ncbi:MAG: MarR family transcriptional regulator [Firmicutes bacterium]|nr:MarR family transcriptional regulator [Bacillota bacterium]